MSDFYRRVEGGTHREIKVKGSRFIASVLACRTADDVRRQISEIKKKEYNATHHCWAYRLGIAGDTFRYGDDGEPSGTAGLPIYRQIEGHDFTDTLVVVTRYYGGTKLGTGGLARAYGDAAAAALDACTVVVETVRDRVSIRFAYADTSPAMHTIDGFDISIEASRYDEETELDLAIRRSQVSEFEAALIQNMAGRVKVTRN